MTPVPLLAVALLATALDQATKALALAGLTEGQPVPILPVLNLSLGFNTGASFGMLSGAMEGRPLVMAALTGAITLAFAAMALRATRRLEALGLAIAVGGSLGNIIDRLRQGAVTDFIDVTWRDWHWPAFNLADIAITTGAALVLLSLLPAFRKGQTDA
ncbi:signal peptidase II [Neotabrizicola sp. VNH66]|uniref:signal peptidase II n=1 Tax=Neotabrizicola sp. VNH66 TaxID=3400918 RepID=UPI003BFEBF57